MNQGSGPDHDVESIVEAERAIRDREASVYETHRSRDSYQRQVENACFLHVLGLSSKHTVIDAGCGTGQHLGMLLDRVHDVIACDHSERSIEQARERVPAGAHERVRFLSADIRDLPVPDGAADRVISSAVIQHIPSASQRLRAMRELHRVLRPGGVLALSVYRWLGHVRRHKEGFWGDGLYRYAFTARELESLFRDAGFTEVRVGGAVVAPSLAERLGISAETQRRLAFTPPGRHLAHYLVGCGERPR